MEYLEISKQMNNIDFAFSTKNMNLKIIWFRVMERRGEWEIQRHLHSTYEVHIVKSGESKVIFDDKELVVKEGDCYLTPPNVYHTQMNTENPHYVEYCFNVDLTLTSDEETEESNIVSILSKRDVVVLHDAYDMIDLFEESLFEVGNKFHGYHMLVRTKIVNMIVLLSRKLSHQQRSNITNYKLGKKNHFDTIQQYIKDNISSPVRTSSIAEHVYLSEKQICRIIKSKTGLTTKEFVDAYRAEIARDFLRNTSLSVSSVSEKLGFTSQFHFSKFFRRTNGCSPSEYRFMSENDI